MAIPAPSNSSALGGMSALSKVYFPDGTAINISTVATYAMIAGAGISFYDSLSGTAKTYFAFSDQELIEHLYRILRAFEAGVSSLELASLALLPTNGSTVAGDIFLNASAAVLGGVTANQRIYLTLGTGATTPAWPMVPFAAACNLVKSFQPDGTVTIGNTPVNNLIYLNGGTMQFFAPAMSAGTYSLTYADKRGSVTVAAIITYV